MSSWLAPAAMSFLRPDRWAERRRGEREAGDAVSGSDAVVCHRDFSVPGALLDVVVAAVLVPDRVQIFFGRGLLLSQPAAGRGGLSEVRGVGRVPCQGPAGNYLATCRARRPTGNRLPRVQLATLYRSLS